MERRGRETTTNHISVVGNGEDNYHRKSLHCDYNGESHLVGIKYKVFLPEPY